MYHVQDYSVLRCSPNDMQLLVLYSRKDRTCNGRMNSVRGEVLSHQTNLTPLPIIEVSVAGK